MKDLAQLATAVEDVQTQAPITAEIQRLIQPGVTLGGARPKALLQTDNGPCIIKFSEVDDPVDTPLIEHATMTLAAQAGLYVANTAVLPLTMRNLDLMDTRDKLAIYAKAGLLSLNSTTALAQLESENKK